jgi:hypothetical protein
MKETDILTFRNHKGEEKTITRQEFRNAARSLQHIDHRPKEALQDFNFKQEATKEDLKFKLTHINDKPV